MIDYQQTAAQAKRVLLIFLELLKGGEFSTRELQSIIIDKLEPVSLRTIQRDMNLLRELVPIVETFYRNGQKLWRIPPKQNIFRNVTYINSCELLSFYILKAHLKTFSGTMIEDDIKRLSKKIEEFAPGEVYSPEIIYWDQNNGQYDYTYFDYQLRRVINFITEKKWATVSYRNLRHNTLKTYDAFFHKIFAYQGYLYIATYIPKYENTVALALHGIENIEECKKTYKLPEFNFKDYIKQRFGVYSGVPKDVTLKIDKEFKKYFVNRKWHPTQREHIDENNNLILKMKVPIVPDFIAWILSWNGAITVIEPLELIIKIKQKLELTLEKYEIIKEPIGIAENLYEKLKPLYKMIPPEQSVYKMRIDNLDEFDLNFEKKIEKHKETKQKARKKAKYVSLYERFLPPKTLDIEDEFILP